MNAGSSYITFYGFFVCINIFKFYIKNCVACFGAYRKDNVLRLWNYLLELLRARRMRLELSLQLQQNFQEMLYILDSMEELKLRLLSDDYGKHLMGVEDLLQKHSLVEADINVLGERVKAVVQQSQRFLDQETTEGYRPCDPAIIVERVQQLEVRTQC